MEEEEGEKKGEAFPNTGGRALCCRLDQRGPFIRAGTVSTPLSFVTLLEKLMQQLPEHTVAVQRDRTDVKHTSTAMVPVIVALQLEEREPSLSESMRESVCVFTAKYTARKAASKQCQGVKS
ncbi:hypothetical protein QQF64_010310 [Cirrhinus molitorella]|uniref:Uncharacterized protein n=1 Tax=Cirrhinus molitorella TaxID=172907 RepID=A0ABR3M3N7_9TELE